MSGYWVSAGGQVLCGEMDIEVILKLQQERTSRRLGRSDGEGVCGNTLYTFTCQFSSYLPESPVLPEKAPESGTPCVLGRLLAAGMCEGMGCAIKLDFWRQG